MRELKFAIVNSNLVNFFFEFFQELLNILEAIKASLFLTSLLFGLARMQYSSPFLMDFIKIY